MCGSLSGLCLIKSCSRKAGFSCEKPVSDNAVHCQQGFQKLGRRKSIVTRGGVFTMCSADARHAKRLSVLDSVDGRKHDTEANNEDLSTGTRVLFPVYSSHHR